MQISAFGGSAIFLDIVKIGWYLAFTMTRKTLFSRKQVIRFILICTTSLLGTQVTEARPKIGLALGGGGARGGTHVGVLEVLEENGIRPDYIAGTSIGSFVGALYATGHDTKKIRKVLETLDWSRLFVDHTTRDHLSTRRKELDREFLFKMRIGYRNGGLVLPSGLVSNQGLLLALSELFNDYENVRNFDHLAIPFRAVAADLETSEEVILGKGNLATAVATSMALPGIFSPTILNGRTLVDGGVSNNLPVSVVREMGADIVIAVNVGSPLQKADKLGNFFAITDQISTFLTRSNVVRTIDSLKKDDILIVPEMTNITVADFDRILEIIPNGREAAERELPKIRHLARRVQSKERPRANPPNKNTNFVIHHIRIDSDARVSKRVFRTMLGIKENDQFNLEHLHRGLSNIISLGLFERVFYEIEKKQGKNTLVVTIQERKSARAYVQFGLNIEENFYDGGLYNLAAGITFPQINALAGELRFAAVIGSRPSLVAELYQPIEPTLRYFVAAQTDLGRETVTTFTGNTETGIIDFRFARFRFQTGRNFGKWGDIRAGLSWQFGESETRIGTPPAPDGNFQDAYVGATLLWDTLDNFNFPNRGTFGYVDWRRGSEFIGGDSDFDQLTSVAAGAITFGSSSTFILAGRSGFSLQENATLQNLYTLGGLFRLSGYTRSQLSGQHMLHGLISYRHKVGGFLPKIVENQIYVGVSAETGNTFQQARDIDFDSLIWSGSAYIGVDALLGPIYFAFGMAENNNYALYLVIGQPLGRGRP